MASYLESPSDQRYEKNAQAGLKPQAEKLLLLLNENPYTTPPPYETWVGNLEGFYSRRIFIQHRLVYRVVETEKVAHVLRMWTHYE
jgi:toxin YoeB